MLAAMVPAGFTTIDKAAAGKDLVQRRHCAGDGGQRLCTLAHIGQRFEQLAAVGMARITVKVCPVGLFHQLPGIHDRHPVRHAGHDAEVMGDQQDSHAGVLLQLLQQLQHLRLDGHIQCRGRFIGNQQVRLAGQRDGDHDALFHAAGQLVRILSLAAARVGNADGIEQLQYPVGGHTTFHRVMLAQYLGNLVTDRQHGIQRGHRFLEDHGNAPPADAAHAGFGQGGDLLITQPDASGGDAADRLWQQAQDGQRGHGFSAAGFAEQCKGLAVPDGETDPVHRADGMTALPQRHTEILDPQQGRFRIVHRSACPGARIEGIAHRIGKKIGGQHQGKHEQEGRQQ
jgi:hypothetical protein